MTSTKHGAAHDGAKGKRQRRYLGQQGIADGVAREDGSITQAHGVGIDDVILSLGHHHHGAHAHGPEAETHQEDREGRQQGVPDDVHGEAPRQRGNGARRVAAKHGKYAEVEAKYIDEDQAQ